jgi:hypothetical protein
MSRWTGGKGVFAVAATIIAGMGVVCRLFPSLARSGSNLNDGILPWAGNPRYYMSRKTAAGRIISR